MLGQPPANQLEQRLGELVGRPRVVEHDGDAALVAAPCQQRLDVRAEDFGRVVPAGPRLLVLSHAHEPWILQRVEPAERDVRVALGAFVRGVEQVVRDQGRRRRRAASLVLQIEDGAFDDVDGAAARDLGIGLDVGDEQLHRTGVRGNRIAQAGGQVGREETRVLRAWRVDDQVRTGQARCQPRVERRLDGTREQLRGALAGRSLRQTVRARPIERNGQQEDVGDAVATRGVDNLGFPSQHSTIDVERHQVGVGAVGDVFDEAPREAEPAPRSRPRRR